MDDIPGWAFTRADALVGTEGQVIGSGRIAFARYIFEHEKPPVDPLLIEAREIVKSTLTESSHKRCNCRAEIDAGEWDKGQKIRASLAALHRGIELGKQS